MDSPPTLHPAPARYSTFRDVKLCAGDLIPYIELILFSSFIYGCAIVMITMNVIPTHVWIGPNSSILVEANSIFFGSVQVDKLNGSESGLQLFGFYTSPRVNVVNWSESRLVSLSPRSSKGWPYYLNERASLNISYTVKPEGCSVRLAVDEAKVINWLLEEPLFDFTERSLNTIQGSGMIQVNISNSGSYQLAVTNPNLKDVEVELDIDVTAVVYDTKEAFYKCNFSNSECTFNTIPFVLTSPAPRQGLLAEEQEWVIRISYQANWIVDSIVIGLIVFMLVAIQIYKKYAGEDEYVIDDDSSIVSLLVNNDDDGPSMKYSCTESLAACDADVEDSIGNKSEEMCATRSRCDICFDAQRDCFFLPCGHCVSCYQCGTKIAEGVGRCPICRKKIEKVNLIYTV